MLVSAGKEQSEQRVGSIAESISSCFFSSLFNSRAAFLLSYMTDGEKVTWQIIAPFQPWILT